MNHSQRTLNVHRLPRDVAESRLAGSVVVVVDVLRASSTICQALASGAAEVVPFLAIDETLAAAEKVGPSNVVLGGERKGGKIPAFDLGNSPCEYTPDAVRGRRVFITTTNGTRALHHARLAERIVVGAFLNLSAVVASIQDQPQIEILCAGTDGAETREDILAAGALVHRLCHSPSAEWHLTDAAAMAGANWSLLLIKAHNSGRPASEQLAIELRDTQGGRNLLGMRLDRDLVDCAQIDRFDIVPVFDVREGRIRAAISGETAC